MYVVALVANFYTEYCSETKYDCGFDWPRFWRPIDL